jgi:hypothetical protein
MADPLDVIGIEEARAVINFGGTQVGSDPTLEQFVTAVSRRLDALCGPIVQRTVTDEPHDGGRCRLFLFQPPVVSVTSVKEYAGTTLTTLTAETNAAQVADQYRLDPRLGVLYRRSGGADYLFTAGGRQNVLVTYTAGRYADTDHVDEPFRTAATLAVKHLWTASSAFWQRQSGFDDLGAAPPSPVPGWAIPRAVIELLATELLAPAVG